ncbi:MAG: hydantoinase B/oxoprolinase family protein [Myxococcales bacterium]|nr:hydantoinase B/oxoprolinase family protein [Myxococcales bacterium]
MSDSDWEFWIDRGGTFTDCIGRDPDGKLHPTKLLSSDQAPVEAIRHILEAQGVIAPGDALPACRVKLGSTVATNALLERRGAPTLLIANRGLGDVIRIGTQERPHLFDLNIQRPDPLHAEQVEVAGRVSRAGEELEAFDPEETLRTLERARAGGMTSAAIVMIHAYAHPDLEQKLHELATAAGFDYVVTSHEIARELGLLARGETTVADAYLTPLLRRHVDALCSALPGSRLRFMQSSGGLTDAARFRGPNALLSGPAGGAVAASVVAMNAGWSHAIAFDMGGTSTDVSLIEDGEVDRAFESEVGGIRVKAPMMRIHTVAAGGGSLCRFDGLSLSVGPESAGAWPGPLCYGRRDDRGDAVASELALTDINFALGRVQPDRFPFALERPPVVEALDRQREIFEKAGICRTPDEIAAGYVEIANANMAEAIAQVSVTRGVDPRDHALIGFGGAAGQHVCGIARLLGIPRVILHPLAGLLSAYGIGLCEPSWDGQRDVGREPLPPDGKGFASELLDIFVALEASGRAALVAEGVDSAGFHSERWLDLRYEGTDVPLSIREPHPNGDSDQADAGAWRAAFSGEHERRFGYIREGHTIEMVTARVRCGERSGRDASGSRSAAMDISGAATSSSPQPRPQHTEYFPSLGRVATPVYDRESLTPGCEISGPALVLEDAGTIVIEADFRARVDPGGVLVLWDAARPVREPTVDWSVVDPVRLEVFGNRFMSIAEQMGASLRNTAVSTNIKDRLDYSCAVFDGQGGLVANAPHIPVHLGAMGETVRAVRERFPNLDDGDVIVTNDPFEGGSHLPDITVVTPIFMAESSLSTPCFYVASRGHHADIGGTTPGSMPPDSQTLEQEGVVLSAFRLVKRGVFDEARLRAALSGARYPARRPDDNVADLEAMVAANRTGVHLLAQFVAEQSYRGVAETMAQLQRAAADRVAREIGKLPDGVHRFADRLDDGTPIEVSLEVRGERMRIDFAGTGAAVPGNLNAPRAVVHAAVIYVLRSLVAERIPLNGGCLDPVEIVIPEGSILDPPEGSAVVGGNVETSQRVVDVLLGALGIAAASQGTMNNVTFGDNHFGYYETIGGGAGAGPGFAGASAVHTHMTNTRITDAEILEDRYPVRLVRFAVRKESGGAGRYRGGDGIERCYEFTAPVRASLLTERRVHPPYGMAGGSPGKRGRNRVIRAGASPEDLASKCSIALEPGDRLLIETPGGGGFGDPDSS